MNKPPDLDSAHRLLDGAFEEAADWLLQAGILLQASAVLAGLTGILDLLGWLPQGDGPDRTIDYLLLMATPELFLWGRRWTRRAQEQCNS